MRKAGVISIGVIVFAVLAAGTAWTLTKRTHADHCQFPAGIKTTLTLYCVNDAVLPSTIRSQSVTATSANNAVVYALTDGNQTLSVSLQQKPTAKQLDNFANNILPLHFDVKTNVGKGIIGVSQQRSILSLPTTSNTWILVTGAADYSPDRMTAIAKSFVQN